MRVNSRRPSGTSAMPWRHTRCGRHRGRGRRRRSAARPPRAAQEAGDGVDQRALARAVRADHRHDLARRRRRARRPTPRARRRRRWQVARLKQHRSCPDRPRRRADRASPRAALPAAITSPSFSTTTRSDSSSTARIRCSTKRMVAPRARICRIRPDGALDLAGLRPDSTSSSRITRGRRGQRARQLEELALVQVQLGGQRRRPPAEAVKSSQCARLVAGLARARTAPRRRSRPARRCRARSGARTAAGSGRCGPRRAAAISCAGRAGERRAVERDPAAVSRVVPADRR